MYPAIGKSTAILADIRRTDNKVNFMYELDATNTTDTQIIWSNQQRFNVLEFQFESLFVPPENLPERPNYVHYSGFGIVGGQIEVNVSRVSRTGRLNSLSLNGKTVPQLKKKCKVIKVFSIQMRCNSLLGMHFSRLFIVINL